MFAGLTLAYFGGLSVCQQAGKHQVFSTAYSSVTFHPKGIQSMRMIKTITSIYF